MKELKMFLVLVGTGKISRVATLSHTLDDAVAFIEKDRTKALNSQLLYSVHEIVMQTDSLFTAEPS